MTLTELGTQLEALEADRPAVAYSLRRTAEALRGDGELRVAGVAAALEDFSRRCRRNETALAELIAECGVPRPQGQRLASVLSQQKAWNWLTGTEPARRLLQRLRSLAADDAELDLGPIRRQLEMLHRTLSDAASADSLPLDVQAEGLAQHPLTALMQLACDDLADDDWESCRERVRSAFGPRLAVAAARGRLSCS